MGWYRTAALAIAAVFVAQAWADLIPVLVTCGTCGTIVDSAATGVNDNGDIVGYFSNGSSDYYGFYDHQGAFTEIAVPGAIQTFPQGINDNGDIVGRYWTGSAYHGFLLPHGGTLQTVDNGTNTMLWGINDSGLVVGSDINGNFIWNGSTFSALADIPGYSGGNTQFLGINDSGVILGDYYAPSWTGVICLSNCLSSQQPPAATLIYVVPPDPGNNYGNLGGISNNGVAAGVYSTGDGNYHPYTYDIGTGQNTLAPDFPGAVTTWANGINNGGNVVGFYQYADGSYFAYETSPEPSGFLLMAGGALVLLIRKRRAA